MCVINTHNILNQQIKTVQSGLHCWMVDIGFGAESHHKTSHQIKSM